MKWDRKQRLPIQTYFHLPSFTHLLPNDKAAIWHIGRFAINSDADCGLILFKQLMLYAMIPIYENRNDDFVKIKRELFTIFSDTFLYNGKEMYLSNIISDYTKKVIKTLNQMGKGVPEFRI